MDGGVRMTELPRAWMNRMRSQLRDEMPAFLNAMEKPALRGIRINTRKSIPELYNWPDLISPVPWGKDCFYLKKGSSAGTTAWHEAGAFYLQEPSAMIPAALLNAQPGEWILDLCAAPGGKATQIGLALNGQGLLVANEPVEKRTRILSRNIERMGIPNAVVTCAKPADLAARWGSLFDAVIVDAPCSGEGMFRRDPETRNQWSPEAAAGCVQRQREILRAAAQLVRPGGRIVYSTCTFNLAENEENTEWFLREHPEYEPEELVIPGITGTNGMYICYPHRNDGEGQFAVRLRRKGAASVRREKTRGLPGTDRDTANAIRRSFPSLPAATNFLGQTAVHLPEGPDLSGIRILRAGLHLGEMRGKTIVPDHASAVAFTVAGLPECEVNAAEASRYLAGEVLDLTENGWTAVRFCGLNLGWGKGSEGFLRNHYPKGLRNDKIICEIPDWYCQKNEKAYNNT